MPCTSAKLQRAATKQGALAHTDPQHNLQWSTTHACQQIMTSSFCKRLPCGPARQAKALPQGSLRQRCVSVTRCGPTRKLQRGAGRGPCNRMCMCTNRAKVPESLCKLLRTPRPRCHRSGASSGTGRPFNPSPCNALGADGCGNEWHLSNAQRIEREPLRARGNHSMGGCRAYRRKQHYERGRSTRQCYLAICRPTTGNNWVYMMLPLSQLPRLG